MKFEVPSNTYDFIIFLELIILLGSKKWIIVHPRLKIPFIATSGLRFFISRVFAA